MRVALDIEANALLNPDKIWVIVCIDIDTGQEYVWRKVTEDEQERASFLEFSKGVKLWIGHFISGYDLPCLVAHDLLCPAALDDMVDTLIVSKLYDYSREGHSIEDYGVEFGHPKSTFSDFSKYSIELENRCLDDARINVKIFKKYEGFIEKYPGPIATECKFQYKVVNALEKNGFYFNKPKAEKYLAQVQGSLSELDKAIAEAFPPREVLIREFTPKATKFGTINKSSVPRVLHPKIHEYEVGKTYRHTRLEDFNPSSHKQIITVLNEAGWRPIEKTKTHIETERELNKLKYRNNRDAELDIRLQKLYTDYTRLKVFGWKVSENNLETLPRSAPSPAASLAKRILLEARRRTLTEWISLVKDDGRIRGRFYGIGSWPHRMAHQNPNTANIPNDLDTQGKKKLLGKEMRSLWCAPKNRLLVGVDAEGIQLRIFAHLIDDKDFTKALVEGKKEDKSDPHSLNQRILGNVCRSRAGAKRFIYALLLGAGIGKLAEILDCNQREAGVALERLLERYQGFAKLKSSVIPRDAEKGWFEGLDGRPIRIPGDTVSQRKHLVMSGYLQSGEVIAMKLANLKWLEELENDGELRSILSKRSSIANARREGPITSGDIKLVNFVHDEWQTETPNNMEIALRVAKAQSDSLRQVGEELQLKCPLAGSYYNEDIKDYTIATNWSLTH